ncbi:porin family protein [Neisseria perflava]|uniref:porin family protein n=1 Tax=Neisseria perflava TaxID=33053 RepID=UPI00209F7BB2|nr:porin family protein [Neisseria perflava]MCP1660999.1 opacity protein-like surface antigen [Neisseria perflava]
MNKNLVLAALLLGSTGASMAAGLNTNGTFTGAAVELGAGAAKSDIKNADLSEKTKADVTVRGNYSMQFGDSNWIGGAEVAVKPLHRTIASTQFGDVKQKYDVGVSYLQGYRLTNDVMAYGKVGYHYGKFDGAGLDEGMNGVGYGLGVKYAVTPNVEAGLEWEQTRYKKDDLKINNNSYMATVAYRFK